MQWLLNIQYSQQENIERNIYQKGLVLPGYLQRKIATELSFYWLHLPFIGTCLLNYYSNTSLQEQIH